LRQVIAQSVAIAPPKQFPQNENAFSVVSDQVMLNVICRRVALTNMESRAQLDRITARRPIIKRTHFKITNWQALCGQIR